MSRPVPTACLKCGGIRRSKPAKGKTVGRCLDCRDLYNKNRRKIPAVQAYFKAYEKTPKYKKTKKLSDAKPAAKERQRKIRETPEKKEYMRNLHLVKNYGMTAADYDRMLAEQDGHCKLCPRTTAGPNLKRLHVDHCHSTGRVRGLLCNKCNIMLGMAEDNVDRLRAAILYIEAVSDVRKAA